MAKINVINNKSQDLTVDPGANGDSYIQFDINTTGEFRIGVDDDASDAFKISQGSALGTTDTFIVSANGEINKPLTSCFHAYADLQSNVTGNGTMYTVAFANELFDQNSDFASNTFTAPVDGKYLLITTVYFDDVSASPAILQAYINTTSKNYLSNILDIGVAADSNDEFTASMSTIADMTASDTAYVDVYISGLGADTADVKATYTCFCGCLIA